MPKAAAEPRTRSGVQACVSMKTAIRKGMPHRGLTVLLLRLPLGSRRRMSMGLAQLREDYSDSLLPLLGEVLSTYINEATRLFRFGRDAEAFTPLSPSQED